MVEKLTEIISSPQENTHDDLISEDWVIVERQVRCPSPLQVHNSGLILSPEERLHFPNMDEEDMFMSQLLTTEADLSSNTAQTPPEKLCIPSHSNQTTSPQSPTPLRGRSPKPELKPKPAKHIVESLSPKFPRSGLFRTIDPPRLDLNTGMREPLDEYSQKELLNKPLVIISPSSDEGIEVDGLSSSTLSSHTPRSPRRRSLNSPGSQSTVENLSSNDPDNKQSYSPSAEVKTVSQRLSSPTNPLKESAIAFTKSNSSKMSPLRQRKTSAPEVPPRPQLHAKRNYQKQASHDSVMTRESSGKGTNVNEKLSSQTIQRIEKSPINHENRRIPPKVPQRPHRTQSIPSEANLLTNIDEAFESRTDISEKSEFTAEPLGIEPVIPASEKKHSFSKNHSSVDGSRNAETRVLQIVDSYPAEERNLSLGLGSVLKKQESVTSSNGSSTPVPPTPPTPVNAPFDLQELLEKQLAAKDRLEVELRKDLLQLKSLKETVETMEAQLRGLGELKNEVNQLRTICKQMTAEVDLINATAGGLPAPLGETSEDFYKNIYAGPNFRKQKHKSSKHRSRRPITAAGPAVSVEPDLNQPWACSMCTFLNHPQLICCEQCNMHRLARSNRHQGIISGGVKAICRVLNSSPLANLHSSN